MAAERRFFGVSKRGAGPRVAAWQLGLIALLLTLNTGCASGGQLRETEYGYHHRDLSYRIARPGAGWKSIGVKGADLAFRQAQPEPADSPHLMMLSSECGRGSENLSVVARQLMIGLGERELRQAAPIAFRGSPGWMQVFETEVDGVVVRVKTISIRDGGCTFDWALVASGAFGASEAEFDVWWSSFERLTGDQNKSAWTPSGLQPAPQPESSGGAEASLLPAVSGSPGAGLDSP